MKIIRIKENSKKLWIKHQQTLNGYDPAIKSTVGFAHKRQIEAKTTALLSQIERCCLFNAARNIKRVFWIVDLELALSHI